MDQYGMEWPEYEPLNRTYVDLNTHNVTTGQYLEKEACQTYDFLYDYYSR